MPKFLVYVHEERDAVYLVEAATENDAVWSSEQWTFDNLYEDQGGNEEVTKVVLWEEE